MRLQGSPQCPRADSHVGRGSLGTPVDECAPTKELYARSGLRTCVPAITGAFRASETATWKVAGMPRVRGPKTLVGSGFCGKASEAGPAIKGYICKPVRDGGFRALRGSPVRVRRFVVQPDGQLRARRQFRKEKWRESMEAWNRVSDDRKYWHESNFHRDYHRIQKALEKAKDFARTLRDKALDLELAEATREQHSGVVRVTRSG